MLVLSLSTVQYDTTWYGGGAVETFAVSGPSGLTTLSIEGLSDGTVLTGGHPQYTVIAIGPAVTAAHRGVLTPRATTGAGGRGRWTSGKG